MTLRQAAIELLRASGPKHYEKLTEEILAKGLASSSSKTPAASLNAMIAVDIKRNGAKSEFVRVRPGVLRLTDRGRDFLDHEGGDAEAFLDEQEGLAKLLALVADNGPTRAGGLIEEWTEYLTHHSAFGSDSTFRDTLRRRLNNLLDRELIARKGTLYSITDAGLSASEPRKPWAVTSSSSSGRWSRSSRPPCARACASCSSTWIRSHSSTSSSGCSRRWTTRTSR
jgi:hypothetical protein